jgi:hypothetical protein
MEKIQVVFLSGVISDPVHVKLYQFQVAENLRFEGRGDEEKRGEEGAGRPPAPPSTNYT